MGLLGKVAAYRWLSAGRGGGGGGGAGLVVVAAVFVGVIGVLWAVASLLSVAYELVYGVVRPILMVYPPVTVPLAVVLVGWPFTWLRPYSAEKTTAFLDGTGDSVSFGTYTVWAVVAINVVFLTGHYDAFPEPNGIVGVLVSLGAVCVSLYGLYEAFHFPYRTFRLLSHVPRSRLYVIGILSPLSVVLVGSLFDVPLGLPSGLSQLVASELAVTMTALGFLNWTYLGGAVAVLWNRDVIRTRARTAERTDSRDEPRSKPSVYTESDPSTD